MAAEAKSGIHNGILAVTRQEQKNPTVFVL